MPTTFVLPFEPNWEDEVRYRITYPSTVHRAFNGFEQRIMLRTLPQLEFEATYTLGLGKESELFDAMIWRAQGVGLLSPLWLYASRIPLPLGAGSIMIPLPQDNPYFGNGDTHLALIDLLDNTQFEFCIIDHADDKFMYLAKPTERLWDAYTTFLVPVRPARTAAEVQLSKVTSTITNASCVFKFQDTPLAIASHRRYRVGSKYVEDYTDIPKHHDAELYAYEPNRVKDITVSSKRDVYEMDFTTGRVTVTAKSPFTATTRDFTWLLSSTTEILDFLHWWDRRKGRCIPCWMPSNQHELTLRENVAATDTQLVLDDYNMEVLYEYPGLFADRPHPLRSHIYLRAANGEYYTTQIINIESKNTLNGTVTVNIDPIGKAIDASGIVAVGFLHHMRADSDMAEIIFYDKRLAEVTVKMTEVLYEKQVIYK